MEQQLSSSLSDGAKIKVISLRTSLIRLYYFNRKYCNFFNSVGGQNQSVCFYLSSHSRGFYYMQQLIHHVQLFHGNK